MKKKRVEATNHSGSADYTKKQKVKQGMRKRNELKYEGRGEINKRKRHGEFQGRLLHSFLKEERGKGGEESLAWHSTCQSQFLTFSVCYFSFVKCSLLLFSFEFFFLPELECLSSLLFTHLFA